MNTLYYGDDLKILREYIKDETVLLKDVHGLESVGTRTPSSACSESLTLADGGVRVPQYRVIAEPEDLDGSRQFASEDRCQFQWWALSLIKARPLGGNDKDKTGKKGADKGIDGTITFIDDDAPKAKRVIVSVKSGHVNVAQIPTLGHVIDREQAAIGVFLTRKPPGKPMTTKAVENGFYQSPGWHRDYPRLQILTIEDLLTGKQVDMPPSSITFKQAERLAGSLADQANLFSIE